MNPENNTIINTADIAEMDDFDSEMETDMKATKEPEGSGIEFHVSMHNYTMEDMERLIVEAAASRLLGKFSNNALAKTIEERAIAMIAKRADAVLAKVTAEIIDQPIMPKFPGMKAEPVTMREFLGLTGRQYLAEGVDRHTGSPTTDRYTTVPRLQYIVSKATSTKFERELEVEARNAVSEIQAAIKKQHQQMLEKQKETLRAALEHAVK